MPRAAPARGDDIRVKYNYFGASNHPKRREKTAKLHPFKFKMPHLEK
jgi:hypothetical protein